LHFAAAELELVEFRDNYAGMRTVFYCLAVLIAGLSRMVGAAEIPPEFWRNDAQGWVVEAKECGGALCAYLVSYKIVHQHLPGYVPLDEKNLDPARRSVPLCGLQLIGGFKPAKRAGDWDSGWVYDPDSGQTYSGTITQVDSTTAKLRAYIGVPLIGKTLMLHRTADDAAPKCAVAAVSGK
jgi:uncharacterized protein (DUF2147 family)